MKKTAVILAALLAVSTILCSCNFDNWLNDFLDDVSEETVLIKKKPKRSEDAIRLQAELDAEDNLPLYGSLSDREKESYADFCAAVAAHSDEPISLGEYDSEEEAEKALDKWDDIFRVLPYEQAEYFWLDMYNYLHITCKQGGKFVPKVQPKYLMDKESAEAAKPVFDAKVDQIVSEAEKQPTLYDKVIFVYDYILDCTEYDTPRVDANDYDDAGINAYGSLALGKTVCSGYTSAFSLIMQRLGVECGVEFNSYDDDTDNADAHVWNYCKLDGDYYYFDLTWDDTSFSDESFDGADHAYLYFGIDREELEASHEVIENPPVPYCGGRDYNYYIRGGMSLESYDFDAVSEIITAQKDESMIVVRFDSEDQVTLAESELLEPSLLFEILPDIESYSWVIPTTKHHLCIFVES